MMSTSHTRVDRLRGHATKGGKGRNRLETADGEPGVEPRARTCDIAECVSCLQEMEKVPVEHYQRICSCSSKQEA